MADLRYLAEPHPEWADFPNNLPPSTKVVEAMPRERQPVKPQADLAIYDLHVGVRDGAFITVRHYRKKDTPQPLPLFVYMHGGGYVKGGLETDDSTCRAIAASINVVVLNVEYRLAPEHKFPIGLQDSFDVVQWVTTDTGRSDLNVDLTKGFILGGTSAGANFTAGIAHLAQQEKLSPQPTGLVFLAGSFCHPDARPEQYRDRILSVDEIDDAPGLTRTSINKFAEQYGAPPLDRRLSPLLYESRAGIAQKAYFAICGWDPRRDEAILLEQLLKEDGLDTRSDMYPGLPHGFWTTCPDLEVSQEWLRKLLDATKWLLE